MIDLATYRCRIGCFQQKIRKTRNCSNQTGENLKKWSGTQKAIFRALLLLTLMLSTIYLAVAQIQIDQAQVKPSQELFEISCHSSVTNLMNIVVECIPVVLATARAPAWLQNEAFELEDSNFLARYTYGNRREHGIKIVHWNKGPSHLENKMDDVEALVEKYRPHILGLSESNLFSHHDLSNVQLQEYTLHICPTILNPDLSVSRVVVYTHQSLVVKLRPDLMDQRISAIWLEVGLPRRRKILVCNTYREWGHLGQADKTSHSVVAQFARWSIFIGAWEKAIAEEKEIIVTGDINIDSLKWMNDDLPASDSAHKLRSLIELLFEKIIPHGISQLVTVATRSGPRQVDSCLDHLYSNKPDKLSEVAVHVNGGSDHKVVCVTRYAKSMKKNVRYIRKRSFKNFDTAGFQAEVAAIRWFDVYSSGDVNVAVSLLTTKLSSALDKYAPIKTIQVRSRYAPWLSERTKEIMVERDLAQQAAKTLNDADLWRNYRNLRNTAVRCMRGDRNQWEKSQLDNFANSPTDLWRNVKGWMGWKNTGPPSQLFYRGSMISSPQGLADSMNSFFIDKVQGLRANLPPATKDPLETLRVIMSTRTCQFHLKTVHPDEVLKMVKDLKNSKSTGLDDIDTWTLKLVIQDILPALTHVLNLSITNLDFPNSWKLAKVIPLLKKDDPLNPKNYRPVALLPIMSKILERIVFKQVVEYLESNSLLHPSHHGSRSKHSTCTALIEMYDTWINSVEESEMAGVMMIDLSAAFDLVDHDILLKKLDLFGFDQATVTWFWSYLNSRSQCVYVDGKFSGLRAVDCGVPQGSVLGPLLYILFVNDLPEIVHGHAGEPVNGPGGPGNARVNLVCKDCGGLCCYVDDSTYVYSSSDPVALSEKLSDQYEKLAEYMANNKLVINADKTHLLVMGTPKFSAARQLVRIKAGNEDIEPTKTEKLLGLHIHESLKWKEHVLANDASLIKMLTTRLSALKKISKNGSFMTRLMVANSCFMSIITYMIGVWGGTETYIIKAVQVMQNKAARCITKRSWYTPTRTLLRECNWLSIKQLIFYHTVLQVWKVKITQLPVYISSRMEISITRSALEGTLRVPAVESDLAQKSFMVRSAVMWNQIPADLKSNQKLESFKKHLKQWTKANVEIN